MCQGEELASTSRVNLIRFQSVPRREQSPPGPCMHSQSHKVSSILQVGPSAPATKTLKLRTGLFFDRSYYFLVHTEHKKRGKLSSGEKVLKCSPNRSWSQTQKPRRSWSRPQEPPPLSERQTVIDLTCFMGTISQA